ncbi:PqqD family protein [Streptomyces sp. B1866]|uniref:PqqD family protein n=1 Tax=Streptomyces sp. B1866 TaxID=3075431 RepID=UPI00288DAD96|nr:PqqD family protein [Streptomyces sp. B1866]MDT3397423.1 PqqD family protein [Streptomyces sp. B1866]
MLTLTPGVRVLADPTTGRATLTTPSGQVWLLNATATTAVSALADGGTVVDAEAALVRAWPAVPAARLRTDLDALLGTLQQAGAVTAS